MRTHTRELIKGGCVNLRIGGIFKFRKFRASLADAIRNCNLPLMSLSCTKSLSFSELFFRVIPPVVKYSEFLQLNYQMTFAIDEWKGPILGACREIFWKSGLMMRALPQVTKGQCHESRTQDTGDALRFKDRDWWERGRHQIYRAVSRSFQQRTSRPQVGK